VTAISIGALKPYTSKLHIRLQT